MLHRTRIGLEGTETRATRWAIKDKGTRATKATKTTKAIKEVIGAITGDLRGPEGGPEEATDPTRVNLIKEVTNRRIR